MSNMADELQLPIDIHYNKLLDWLIDRRHCDGKWAAQVRRVRERIQSSLPQLPLDLQPDSQPLNYFQCQETLGELKRKEGDSKSIFGKYLSPRVQEWSEIVQDFEKGRVYLADCAQQLIRNVNYEIPALKQGLARSQQVQQDCLKREQDSRNNAASLRAQFISSCQEMGIKGDKVREELQELLSELPQIFQQTLALLPSLSPAIHYYQSVIQGNTGRPVQTEQFLPMLQYIMKNGNVTVYQWKHGVEPEVEQERESAMTDQPESGIDWGELGQPQEIVWEDQDVTQIEVIDESLLDGGGASHGGCVVISDKGDLESLLLSATTRAQFLDHLLEVKEFLSWRLRELSSTDSLLLGQFSGEGSEMQSMESVETMLNTALAVLEPLTSSCTQHLLLMRNSAHYLDRMTASLLSPQLLANKAQAQAELAAGRREEAVAMALSLQPQLAALVKRTRTLQKQVEQEISQLYRHREVNLIGEINVTLQ